MTGMDHRQVCSICGTVTDHRFGKNKTGVPNDALVYVHRTCCSELMFNMHEYGNPMRSEAREKTWLTQHVNFGNAMVEYYLYERILEHYGGVYELIMYLDPSLSGYESWSLQDVLR